MTNVETDMDKDEDLYYDPTEPGTGTTKGQDSDLADRINGKLMKQYNYSDGFKVPEYFNDEENVTPFENFAADKPDIIRTRKTIDESGLVLLNCETFFLFLICTFENWIVNNIRNCIFNIY